MASKERKEQQPIDGFIRVTLIDPETGEVLQKHAAWGAWYTLAVKFTRSPNEEHAYALKKRPFTGKLIAFASGDSMEADQHAKALEVNEKGGETSFQIQFTPKFSDNR